MMLVSASFKYRGPSTVYVERILNVFLRTTLPCLYCTVPYNSTVIGRSVVLYSSTVLL